MLGRHWPSRRQVTKGASWRLCAICWSRGWTNRRGRFRQPLNAHLSLAGTDSRLSRQTRTVVSLSRTGCGWTWRFVWQSGSRVAGSASTSGAGGLRCQRSPARRNRRLTPVVGEVEGDVLGQTFGARMRDSRKQADARHLRGAIEDRGYQVLGSDGQDVPRTHPARGWLETGAFDKLGHDLGAVQFARQLGGEIERLAERITRLLDAGWTAVRVVTESRMAAPSRWAPKGGSPKASDREPLGSLRGDGRRIGTRRDPRPVALERRAVVRDAARRSLL